jgi:GNAT superfamily N-acetyltransferase
MKQLIYKQTRNELFDLRPVEGRTFICAARPSHLPAVWRALMAIFGPMGSVKAALKLAAGKRRLYLVLEAGAVIHFGWVSIGFCRYYKVGRESCVIGPIFTAEAARGRGIATWAIQCAMDRLIEEGRHTFYIDTAEDNAPCLKAIRKSEFGTLVGTYDRTGGNNAKAPARWGAWARRVGVPQWVKALARPLVGTAKIQQGRWQMEYDDALAQARRISVDPSMPKLGIVRDIMLRHAHYEAACLELGVPYEVLDITGPDWVETVQQAACAAFIVRPFVLNSRGKRIYDERVRLMAETMGKFVYPSVQSLWLYESKRRCTFWLQAHGIPHPRTWVFNDETAAAAFGGTCALPILFKTDLGSEALGVRVLRDRDSLRALVRQCFSKGVAAAGYDDPLAARGEVILQTFIPNAREWRMVRIGDSYFGHRKGRAGDFHSGSKIIEFDTPPERLLRFVQRVTDAGPFDNMALDILETADGEYLVIELHCYFGCNSPHVMLVDGKPGRFRYDADRDDWRFEAGDFNRNASCNLRVDSVLSGLGHAGAGNLKAE